MTEAEQESHPTKPDSGDESEDESEVLEESPCGRWQKRREEVEQRDVPGIDNAFLAMDTEEGVEVVWNEVQFSEKKNFKAQQDKIRQVFDNLIQLEHPNIVNFHKYWTDTKGDKPRVIFITEYMSSGSLKQFMKKTKKNNRQFPLKSWKRWCTQILSALSYLHSCDPPIIHGNLTCDTIFIQHNGLIKIGSVAPDAIHLHVKTYRDDLKNMHCIAPDPEPITTKVDMYSFGMCALEMAALGFHGNGEGGNLVTLETIQHTLDSLDNKLLKDFLVKCIERDPNKRPNARELLFEAVLFEVHSLKLLSAHTYAKTTSNLPEKLTEEACFTKADPNKVIAEINHPNKEPFQMRFSQVPALELEKFLEDVRNGVYPLTAFAMPRPPPSRPQAKTPELAESVKSETPEHMDVETRMVINMSCQTRKNEDNPTKLITILLRMDDKMNRQLQCELSGEDNSTTLAEELVHYGFINELDRDKVAVMIDENLKNGMCNESSPTPPIAIPSS
ncbi:LOW QUALITY PROTEIN: nuclear receptor-binding protein-like [Haliotis rubra]|uniref:LOW QUALITY PROTEIN: nuclear receptor-binding protein-like n=1 Tax=Haliotis rubra TaxID=36100 RepID=UPI001EE60F26|nr:LOW QUALITY PROTEIN: nuclear receptor-binding protein-like [Haliotis rubra]